MHIICGYGNVFLECNSRCTSGLTAGIVEVGAVVPGLAGDVPGGKIVPADGGTVPGKVGPVMPVVTSEIMETFHSIDGRVKVIVQQKQT